MTSFAPPRFVATPVQISWMAFHEAGHVVAAAVLGCPVLSTRIHGGGGSTFVDGDPRDMLLISLAGHAAEYVLDVRDLDIRCSTSDVEKAFKYAIEVARAEERTTPKTNAQTRAVKPPAAAFKGSVDLLKLSAFDLTGVERNASRVAERIAARWVARAHVLVDAAEVEARELIGANRRATRAIAQALEENKQLDAVTIIQLAGEGRLQHDERWRKET